MKVEGSLLAILFVAALGAVSFGGVGLLTASRAQKIESVSGLINLVMMPMWIFSGVFFSYERFPAGDSAADQGAAADSAERRVARHHLAGRELEFAVGAAGNHGDLGRRVVRDRAEVVSLELS